VAKTFGDVRVRVFCHATESLDKVRRALNTVVDEGEVREDRAQGHHGNPIMIISSVADGPGCAERLLGRLEGEVLEEVFSTLPSRVDESCRLRLRFDKQAAFQGRLELSDGGDVIAVSIRILAFPARQELALESAARFLEKQMRAR